ncbi:hypothetical protein M0R45_011130 [Rubus argutus]|uniref:Uncharacterized protein n=1 Tax=Rubus argutus TaxID=59490 RepID=A0AAW1YAQ8_RUBAR
MVDRFQEAMSDRVLVAVPKNFTQVVQTKVKNQTAWILKSLPWPESCEEMVDEGLERTIIFNPRVCNDIDLDIGKWIRIHPPWKEINGALTKT